MRKIEREMIQAIIDRRSFNKANTSVSLYKSATQMGCGLDTGSASEMRVHLHGNHIASYTEDGQLFVNHQGWKTVTTKSRLNSLINFAVDPTRNGIHQKNFEWYIRRDGVVYNMPQGWHQV